MGTLISFENVGKIYRTGDIEYEALHDVNLTIDEGEMLPHQEKSCLVKKR